MLKEGAAGPLASGRAASSPRAALLSLGADLAGLGGKQGLDSLTRVTRTPAATNFLIPCKTLAMAHFFLGQGFPNCTTGNTGSLFSQASLGRSSALGIRRKENRKVSAHSLFVHRGGSLLPPRLLPERGAVECGAGGPWPRQGSSLPN